MEWGAGLAAYSPGAPSHCVTFQLVMCAQIGVCFDKPFFQTYSAQCFCAQRCSLKSKQPECSTLSQLKRGALRPAHVTKRQQLQFIASLSLARTCDQ